MNMIYSKIDTLLRRIKYIAVATILLLAAMLPSFVVHVSAQPLTDRSLKVTSTNPSDNMLAPDGTTYPVSGPGTLQPGDPRNGQKVGHEYTFTPATSGTLEGFTIEYCDSAFGYIGNGECADDPVGFDASAWGGKTVNIDGETFDVVANASNYLTLKLASGGTPLSVSSSTSIVLEFPATSTSFFVNPNTAYKNDPQTNGTYFAHISTFSNATNAQNAYSYLGTGDAPGIVDDGTVTNNVTTAIGIYTRVQETLNFSVEGHIDTDPSGPTPQNGSACSPLVRQGKITLGDGNNALSMQQAYFGKSYFRLSTNSANGTVVYYAGETLKSGSNTIDAIGTTRDISRPGNEQFGLAFDLTDNLVSNVGNGGDLTPEPAYSNNANGYAFDGSSSMIPKRLAASSGTVECDTGSIQYVANIAADTPAGIYQTKINYIASPSY